MSSDVAPFVRTVLKHYEAHSRDHLPWRNTADPYRILVSEMMLQQTQVDRVIPYYSRFLKRFPTVRALAKAPLRDVLKEWSGLGYNRRAKYLWEIARAITTNDGHPMSIISSGGFPREYIELRKLPGVGVYTAKAVRTFAFDEPEIMLETNIRTALIHVFFPRGRRVGDTRLISILESCLAHVNSPRVWYWALMDYGSHIKETHGNASRRSRTYVKQKPFDGSLRQVRGAILRELARAGEMDERVLAQHTGFTRARFTRALAALERDRMVARRDGIVLIG